MISTSPDSQAHISLEDDVSFDFDTDGKLILSKAKTLQIRSQCFCALAYYKRMIKAVESEKNYTLHNYGLKERIAREVAELDQVIGISCWATVRKWLLDFEANNGKFHVLRKGSYTRFHMLDAPGVRERCLKYLQKHCVKKGQPAHT